MFVDLHNHSTYSDGTMTPKEILEAAKKANVSVLAITDHDVLEGSRELLRISSSEKIKVISGVEIDALDDGVNIHVLGYGVDLNNETFCRRIKENREKLDDISVQMIRKMEAAGLPVSPEEFVNAQYDMKDGGWKALYYMVDKGITESLDDGFAMYGKYECGYDIVDFPSVQEAACWIHEAGGIAILAHPGVSIWKKDMPLTQFQTKLEQLLRQGLDGVECFYPKHTSDITRICLAVCKDHQLCITTGSDCHGEFEEARLGELRIRPEFLELPLCLLQEY